MQSASLRKTLFRRPERNRWAATQDTSDAVMQVGIPAPGRNGQGGGLSGKADQGALQRRQWSWLWEDEQDSSEYECVWYPGQRRGGGDPAH